MSKQSGPHTAMITDQTRANIPVQLAILMPGEFFVLDGNLYVVCSMDRSCCNCFNFALMHLDSLQDTTMVYPAYNVNITYTLSCPE